MSSVRSAQISVKNMSILGGLDAEKQLTVQMDNISNAYCHYKWQMILQMIFKLKLNEKGRMLLFIENYSQL